jgi:D-arginine dehydrogenase
MARAQVIVVGGGIAGLSCAAQLAAHCDVTVVEAEDGPGYHSSGRSAASYIEPYVNDTIVALTRASKPFFEAPPTGFADAPLVKPRRDVMIATAAKSRLIDVYLERWRESCPGLVEIDTREACALAPILRPEAAARAVSDPNTMDIDVHGMLSGFRRMLKAWGGTLAVKSRVESLARSDGRWRVATADGERVYDIVVDAAGAWGDQLARLAGIEPVGLTPKRRSALLINGGGVDVSKWPMVHEVESEFYFKPDAGRLLLSPADATPSEPCDAQPEELDLAIAVERFHNATTVVVERIEHRWAGLRSFVADSLPVIGYEPSAPGFFWLIGQGGFGIQTSPAVCRLAAALIEGREVPDDLAERGIVAETFAPRRAALANR